MKIIVNASNLYVGGGLQVALSFLDELRYIDQKNEYHILVSPIIEKQIIKINFKKNFKFYLIDISPAKLFTRKKVIKVLSALEISIKPDVVFTIFGPSYWKPQFPHLLGFADGWVYNPTSIAFNRLPFFKRIKMRLAIKYKLFYLERDADFYVLETNDAKYKLLNIMKKNMDNFFVVGNTVSSVFSNETYMNPKNEYYIKLPNKEDDNEFRLLYIAHNHPSKNISLLNNVLKYLEGYNVKIVLTIDESSYHEIFDDSVKSNVINVGPVIQFSCPSLYKQVDAVISTSLLETFSAVYPEAMKMKKPILSSNFLFARDTCSDSALYFDALDPEDTANKIIMLKNDKMLQKDLIQKGEKKLMTFETANSRACKYLDILRIIKDKNV